MNQEYETSQSHIVNNTLDGYLSSLISQNEALKKDLSQKSEALKQALTQLAHVEKLATLGIIGAGIAHELNNPLTVISAEADEILDSYNDGYQSQELTIVSAQNIKQCAERMRYIVDHIRTYSRKDEGTQWQKININAVIKDSLIILKSHLKSSDIHVDLILSDNIPEIWGNVNKLESVFQNLVSNARDAYTTVTDNRKKQMQIESKGLNGKVLVKVKDNACGIPATLKEKIFEPFFTTKEIGKGTGLGLAIASDYVKEHSGTIKLSSIEGEGTEFLIEFPPERRRN